jgi:hypothetical protein
MTTCADVRKANAAMRRPLTVVPSNYCITHGETYAKTCRGCRADRIAEESA